MLTTRFTKGGLKVGQYKVYLVKIGKLKIVWSRELTAIPSSVTPNQDSANRYFLSFVVEVLPKVLPNSRKIKEQFFQLPLLGRVRGR